MQSIITHIYGEMEPLSEVEMVDSLVDELDSLADEEHFDVSIGNDSGWALTATRGGRLLWGDIEGDTPERLMLGVSRSKAKELFIAFAEGRTDEIDQLPWEK